MNIPSGAGNRASMPPLASPDQQQQQLPPSRSRRVYPVDQTTAYGLGAAATTQSQQPYYDGQQQQPQPQLGQQPYPQEQQQQQQQPSYFVPAGGMQQQQPQQAPQQPTQPVPPAHYQHQRTASMGSYPQPPQQPDMAGLSNQFSNMGFAGQQPQQQQGRFVTQSLNVVGLPLNPAEIQSPPPEIRLPPQTSISNEQSIFIDPSHMRSTINAVPTTDSLLKKSKVPFGLVLNPYRSQKPDDDPVPLVSDYCIARCRRCRTYINPFISFVDNTRWKCCMCNLSNELPKEFDWDQNNNVPMNRMDRAELNHSIVEFLAPPEYLVRAPPPPAYVFLIDVSHAAVRSGMVATAARTILECLDRIPNTDDRTKVSIIAFDSSLHFFSLVPGEPEPSMLVVSDLEEVFLPKPSDLLVGLTECRPALENLLSRFNDMFKSNRNVNNAMGAALNAAYKLISNIGGKVSVLSASLPNVGPGALKNREDSKLLGTPKESTLLRSAVSFYKNLATECTKVQVSYDMWLFSSQYTDLATLSALPRYTAGQTYYYPSFDAARVEDAVKFAHEFGQVITQPFLHEAVLRVRASQGLKMTGYYGNFFNRASDLLGYPTVSHDQACYVECGIEDPLNVTRVIFQSALLHTNSNGERRIRVMTLALPTTTSISEVYGSVDQVALTSLLAYKAVERATQYKLEDARDALTNKLVDIVGTYKATMTAGGGPSPQLILPNNLKFLPLLLLGILKHVGIRQSAQITPDHRIYAQELLTTLPIELLIPYLHPTFYSLHNMPKEAGTVSDQGSVILPTPLPLTSERFERHGLYLIENSQNIFLWVGRDAVPQLIKDVFDLPSYQELRSGKTSLPVLENSFSQRVNAVVGKIREMRRGVYWPELYIVREDGEPAMRMWALSMLLEDRSDAMPSYNQWLSIIKDKVNSGSY